MELHSTVKQKETMISVGPWMEFIVLGKTSQAHKDKYHMTSLTWSRGQKNKTKITRKKKGNY